MSFEFSFPAPNSMVISDAAKWYRAMVPLIPKIKVDDAYGENEKELQFSEFKAHWCMKARLRLTAAAALYDPELADEFFLSFPLPSADEFLGRAYRITGGENLYECALYLLLEISESERRRFPGTVGEAVGMECHTLDGIYVMTEEGWKKKVS